MELLTLLWETALGTVFDLAPILALIFGFQWIVLRQPVPHLKKLLIGMVYVFIGLVLFLVGLEKALFPIGRLMATQLSSPNFVFGMPTTPADASWEDYGWVYLFALLVGFSTTIAEPALFAVATKAAEVSRGTIDPWGLRVAVAIGVAIGITLGVYRIITGYHIGWFIIVGYVFVVIQTYFAPRFIIPLAYDSGGVTTSTVTVPLVAALGLGLSSTVPGRNPAVDGFGLIAFASLFPMMTVMGYAQVAQWVIRRRNNVAVK